MRDRGILLTLAIVTVGMTLYGFGIAYRLAADTSGTEVKLTECEKTDAENANIAYNSAKNFKEYSGIETSQTAGAINISETLPNVFHELNAQNQRLDDILKAEFPNTTVTNPPQPTIMWANGMNYTHSTDRTVLVHLPESATEVTITAHILENITSCNMSSESTGDLKMRSAVYGETGACIRDAMVNASAETMVEINDGGLRIGAKNRDLSITNNLGAQMAYTLSLRVNDTGDAGKPAIGAKVETAYGRCAKSRMVSI